VGGTYDDFYIWIACAHLVYEFRECGGDFGRGASEGLDLFLLVSMEALEGEVRATMSFTPRRIRTT
jgi:hypothetical protein